MSISLLAFVALGLNSQSVSGAPIAANVPGATAADPLPITRGIEYPARALERGVSGNALIRCRVGTETVLTACTVVSETPPGVGFGREAIRAAPRQTLPADTPLIGKDVFFKVSFTVQ